MVLTIKRKWLKYWKVKKQKRRRPIFYLVPNHIKFESEVDILKQLGEVDADTTAQSAVQVLSFTRLAWFFLRNTPEYQKQRISQAGINMLIYQIIVDNQDKLVLFSHEIHNPGFIDQLSRQIREMQAGNVSPENLLEMLENDNSTITNDLRDKLHDLPLFTSNTSNGSPTSILIVIRSWIYWAINYWISIYPIITSTSQASPSWQPRNVAWCRHSLTSRLQWLFRWPWIDRIQTNCQSSQICSCNRLSCFISSMDLLLTTRFLT